MNEMYTIFLMGKKLLDMSVAVVAVEHYRPPGQPFN